MVNKYREYTDIQIIEAVKNSKSASGVCRLINIKPVGGNLATVKRHIARLDLDISHFTGSLWNKGIYQIPEKSKKNENIRKFMIKHYGHKCWECNNTTWNNKPIPLELEHTDGNRLNNEITNLKMLCCNCHAQTPTWRRQKSSLR